MTQNVELEQYGMAFSPKCEFKVHDLSDTMGWCASVEIGECYYETDYYADKQKAIDEQRGCLLAIKEQIEKYLATLD